MNSRSGPSENVNGSDTFFLVTLFWCFDYQINKCTAKSGTSERASLSGQFLSSFIETLRFVVRQSDLIE